jgi:hypothetical protein
LKSFKESIDAITDAFHSRNKTKFRWADGETEILANPPPEVDDDEDE